MGDTKTIDRLRRSITRGLPGWDAQKLMMPETRKQFELPVMDELHPAAVLIALFPANGSWRFPLIRRTDDGFAHSGQIALPGGRKEGSESAIDTALREAKEEVNLPPSEIEILGKTSQLPIPVSKHIVQPIIGFMNREPDLQPEPKEVAEIITISLEAFAMLDIQTEVRQFSGVDFQIPYFEIEGHRVWGATGMILSEFRHILSDVV